MCHQVAVSLGNTLYLLLFVFGSKQEQDGEGIRQPVKRNSLSRLKIVTNKKYQQSLVAEKNKIET